MDKPVADGGEKPEAMRIEAWRLFDLTVAEVKERFADLSPDEVQVLIDEALDDVRGKICRDVHNHALAEKRRPSD